MTVPEAAVDEHSRSMAGKDYVRRSRQISPMQAEAKPCGMKRAPHCDLWLGILSTNAGHHAATRLPIYDIH
jgi:hypothetical protein